jgi:hypothetical protein
LVNATQQVGGALGTALLNTVAATAATSYLAHHVLGSTSVQRAAVHGYTTAFTISAALLLLAALTAGLLIRNTDNAMVVDPAYGAELEQPDVESGSTAEVAASRLEVQ